MWPLFLDGLLNARLFKELCKRWAEQTGKDPVSHAAWQGHSGCWPARLVKETVLDYWAGTRSSECGRGAERSPPRQ
jgi:hypothetical protein